MKTSELIGPALDWAVAKIEGVLFPRSIPNYSNDWSQAGPIIERELISIESAFKAAGYGSGGWYWRAACITEDDKAFFLDGPTPLIAAMRCYVASILGDEIEIPEELK